MTRIVVTLLALVGCHPDDPVTASAPAAAAATTDRWSCTSDAECMTSCRYGAVRRAWYEATVPRDCHDGCANQLAEPPRCIDRGCVAFSHDPQDAARITRDDACTRKP